VKHKYEANDIILYTNYKTIKTTHNQKCYLGRTRLFFAKDIWKMKCRPRYRHSPQQ